MPVSPNQIAVVSNTISIDQIFAIVDKLLMDNTWLALNRKLTHVPDYNRQVFWKVRIATMCENSHFIRLIIDAYKKAGWAEVYADNFEGVLTITLYSDMKAIGMRLPERRPTPVQTETLKQQLMKYLRRLA